MVVPTGAELFTGNTLITISVLDGQASVAGMLLSLSARDLAGRVVGAYTHAHHEGHSLPFLFLPEASQPSTSACSMASR